MKRNLLTGWFCLLSFVAFAQEEPVLMRINGKEVLRSEFEYFYRRYADKAGSGISPEKYAGIFIQSKLRVEAARAAGLDTASVFRRRQEEWRARLVESYLTDRQVMDSCMRALYRNGGLQELGEQVQVMQVFRRLPQTITPRRLEEEKNRMDSIRQMMRKQPDSDFARWVQLYSDEVGSRWVTRLQTTEEFEKVAFSLAKGEISEPFFTPEGIHILKVTDRKGMPAYEDVYDKLAERLRRGENLDKSTEAVVDRLKREWRYVPVREGIEELSAKGRTGRVLFTIDGQPYSGELFRQFAASHPQALKRQLDGFIAKSLLDYEAGNLERKYPEIRFILQEAAENYLVAAINRRKIDWPAMNDRAGLATYFKFHTSDYRWERPRYKGIVLHCADKKTARRAKKLLKKIPEEKWAEVLCQTFNTSGAEKIKVEQGVFADGDNEYVDKLVFKKGGFTPLMSYPFTAVAGRKQKGPDDYREVIDRVREDYRNYLDMYWTRELKDSAKIEIYPEVLKTVNNN